MGNSGGRAKPFLFAEGETREYFILRLKYCTITTKKTMDNIGGDDRPYFVKIFESWKVRVLGMRIRYREQSWTYDKL